jgi:uncharacterized phage-associated protein
MIDSIDLCNIIIRKAGPMNQLKVQKLVYYYQAFHLVFFDVPVVEDEFVAGVHGPTSLKILKNYSRYSMDEDLKKKYSMRIDDPLSKDQETLLDEVLERYSPLASYQLEVLSHSELPWKEARGKCTFDERSDIPISLSTMKAYYGKFATYTEGKS